MKKKWAQEFPYWETSVDMKKSIQEMASLLQSFGANRYGFENTEVSGNPVLSVVFSMGEKGYQVDFRGKEVYQPFRVKNHKLRVERQLGRLAYYGLKSLLALAQDMPEAMTGFLLLPGGATVHQAVEERYLLAEG
jgi:hypothetical protein